MPESTSSRWWPAAKKWGSEVLFWGLLLGVGVYLYRTVSPDIDVTESLRPAPDFTAQTLSGAPFQLSDYRGQVVVLNVWATWCGPCRFEMPSFVELQEEFRSEGVQFVGLNVDEGSLDGIASFVDAYNLNYPQVDGRAAAYRHYSGDTIPRTYLIGRGGTIRYVHEGVILKGALRNALQALVTQPAPASARGTAASGPR